MKKIGLLILSLIAIVGGLVLILKDKIFGGMNRMSEESKGLTTASTVVPNVIYVTQNVSGNAVIGSLRVSNAGTIAAGKIFFKIENVGAADGTVNVGTGVRVLKPSEFVVYNESLNPNVKPSGSVAYDASLTEFIIDTVDA